MKYGNSIPVLGLFVVSACGSLKPSHSRPQAQIDAANDVISRYGLTSMPTYDELLPYKTVEMKDARGNARIPWVDSYWPTLDKGLARRWGFINAYNEPNLNDREDFMLGAFFKTQQQALQQDKDIISLNLAPSEKFDIAFRLVKGLNAIPPVANIPALEVIDAEQSAFSVSDLNLDAIVTAKREFANEYLGVLNTESGDSQTASPMTVESLNHWLSRSADPDFEFPGYPDSGISWAWEGICHGWAAAAIMSEEPRHAVRIEIPNVDGQKKSLFFTEGDIRALLSRAWSDDNSNGQFFVGKRCNKSTQTPELGVPVNAEGRAISGRMRYQTQDGRYLTSPFTIVQDYPRPAGPMSLYRIILEREWSESGPRYGYLIQTDIQDGNAEYRITFDEAEAFKEVESPDAEKTSRPVKDVEIYGCWDVNPASFHTLLVKNIGDKNLGIIMDRSQTGQVWNQPIARAEFTMDALRPVAELAGIDNGLYYRAPGTAYLAQVSAVVYWGREPRQQLFSYTQNGRDVDLQNFVASRYQYTLEFDQNRRLIGGEWGDFEKQSLPKDNPDFIYGYTRRSEPDLSEATTYIRQGYDLIIRKIHACSLSDNPSGKLTLTSTANGQTIKTVYPFSTCQL